MTTEASNHIKYLLATGAINFSSDQFVLILMNSTFVFDKDDHEDYADVSASELATAYGYTVKSKVLTGVTVTEDDTDDRTEVTWSNATWTASEGDIGPAAGAIIIDDTATDDPIVGYIDFGGSYTQADGGVLTITGIEVRIS